MVLEKTPQTRAEPECFGEWDSEWSLGRMLRVLRVGILDIRIDPTSATKTDL
jgi:hypothetical protein